MPVVGREFHAKNGVVGEVFGVKFIGPVGISLVRRRHASRKPSLPHTLLGVVAPEAKDTNESMLVIEPENGVITAVDAALPLFTEEEAATLPNVTPPLTLILTGGRGYAGAGVGPPVGSVRSHVLR